MGFKTGISAARLEFGLQDWNLGLETGIWAFGLEFEGGGTEKKETEKKEKEKKEEEKIPHMCESIGHRPLRRRCPAPPSNSTSIYLSRARVPLTI